MVMRYPLLLFLIGFNCLSVTGQILPSGEDSDSRYFEDQFYTGVTYNFVMDLPSEVSQRNLSYGLQAGLIKDIPLDVFRTIALGVGLGYGINSYYTNLKAVEQTNQITYTVLDDNADFKRSKIATHVLEMPIQFRWRNSTPEEYKFWRIYSGLKMGYVFDSRSKFVSSSTKNSFANSDVRSFQYGLTLDVGYNTFNIHFYYALSTLFNDGVVDELGDPLQLKPLRVGLIFYIL